MLYGKNDSEDADVIDVNSVKGLPEKQKRLEGKIRNIRKIMYG